MGSSPVYRESGKESIKGFFKGESRASEIRAAGDVLKYGGLAAIVVGAVLIGVGLVRGMSERQKPTPSSLPSDTATGMPTIFCRNCGAQIKADSKFCEKCGAKLKE